MKPVLIVDGKELDVMEINYSNGQVVTAVVEVEQNVYETYSCRSYLFVSDVDKTIDFEESLKFKNRYDDLIAHLDEMLKDANDDLTEIAVEAMENKIKRMKESMQEAMVTANERKVQGKRFSFNVQKSPTTLKIDDESYIPEGYWEPQPPKLNRRELLDDLKQGAEVMGVELTQGEHLRIR